MLPKKYQFLDKIGTLPKLVNAGLLFLGIKEIPGKQSNEDILKMAEVLGIEKIYTQDSIAWCGLFMAYLLHITGKPQPYKQYEILRAASFASWGNPVSLKDVQLGDIAVFRREGGGHVGLVLAVSKNIDGGIGTLHILGGNQGDKVSIAEFPINRVTHVRRYYATQAPESAKQYVIDSSGVMSVNES
jgi:uncharacterized protein (TIGR02594 family)